MKTIDEILDLADIYAEGSCPAICDALYKNEDEARDKILELELRLCEATEMLDRVMKICEKYI
jgi:predicted oxidoreductase